MDPPLTQLPLPEPRLFDVSWSFRCVLKLTIAAVIGAVVGLFALCGGLLGAITGALTGRSSNRGLLRGSLLGAAAGTILSLEILEALRVYLCAEESGDRVSLSMADFIGAINGRNRGRLVEGQLEPPPLLLAYPWQMSLEIERSVGFFDDFSGGLSQDSLKELPHHVIHEEAETEHRSDCCPICLQNFEIEETARRLPSCHHMFHLKCVDKWLIKQGTCPICRQFIKVHDRT